MSSKTAISKFAHIAAWTLSATDIIKNKQLIYNTIKILLTKNHEATTETYSQPLHTSVSKTEIIARTLAKENFKDEDDEIFSLSSISETTEELKDDESLIDSDDNEHTIDELIGSTVYTTSEQDSDDDLDTIHEESEASEEFELTFDDED